ncbi:MAG: hypothetical protein ACMUHM_04725 [Thermoplasmatota archaeon]
MVKYCIKCGNGLDSNYCERCRSKVEKRTGTRLGLFFFFITMLLYSISAITMVVVLLQGSEEAAPFAVVSFVSFFIAPIFFYLGSGAMLAGRNDLDRKHRIRATLGSIIYILSPLLALLYFTLGKLDYRGIFVGIAVAHSIMALTLGGANYLFTCHLTEGYYFKEEKDMTRKLIRGSYIFLGIIAAIYILGSIIIIYTKKIEDLEYFDEFFHNLINFYAFCIFLVSVYFFLAAMIFIILFIGISGKNMNEEGMIMGRADWESLQYRLYLASLSDRERYGIDPSSAPQEDRMVATELDM